MALTVMATGNHFVFDIPAGAAVTAVGYWLALVAGSTDFGTLARRLATVRSHAVEGHA